MKLTIRAAVTAIIFGATGLAAAPADAGASNYCREYTRTVYIGNRTQEAYGTACLQPDGSWMIVGEGLGNDIPQDVNNVTYVVHESRQNIVPPRVVYYDRVYATRPTTVWYNNRRGYERNGLFISYNSGPPYGRAHGYRRDRHDRWDHHYRRDRHDRWDDHRGRGRGRD